MVHGPPCADDVDIESWSFKILIQAGRGPSVD